MKEVETEALESQGGWQLRHSGCNLMHNILESHWTQWHGYGALQIFDSEISHSLGLDPGEKKYRMEKRTQQNKDEKQQSQDIWVLKEKRKSLNWTIKQEGAWIHICIWHVKLLWWHDAELSSKHMAHKWTRVLLRSVSSVLCLLSICSCMYKWAMNVLANKGRGGNSKSLSVLWFSKIPFM